jgi:parvulin-like peptidyl-prolyl isomerase
MKARALLLPMLLLGVLLSGCGGGSATLTEADVATVGSIHISKARFDAQLSLARANLKATGREFPKAGTREYEGIKAQALTLLVQSAARELKAAELDIAVTDKQIADRLAEIKKQLFDGNEKKYQAQLKQQGLTDEEVRAQIKTSLISEQVTQKLTEGLAVGDAEVHEYYVANAPQYTQEERDVLEILVGKDKEELAKDIRRQIAAGADFGALAKKYSQDPGSKDKGGAFTAVNGKDVPEFDRVAFSLETGELAQPVNTAEYGWFIIKAVSDKRTVKTAEKDVRDTIRQQLLDDKRNEAIRDWLTDAAESVCDGGKITYQVGYTPNPDPCAQFTATTTTTATTP